MPSAQSSLELMIILAVSLTVLIAIVSYSNQSINGINSEKQLVTAQDSVNEIVNAANDVYHQGVGARKKVFYTVPSAIDKSKSGIENKSVVFNVLENDVYAKADAPLSGSIPTEIGGHWVWVEAKEGYVSIGAENITADKTAIYTTLEQDSNAKETITITNDGKSTALVSIAKTWVHSNVTLFLSETSFSLSAANTKAIDLNFNANSSASGIYSGSIQVNASFNGSDQNILIPVTAEVTTLGQSASNLAVFPASYSAQIFASDSDSNAFQTCNLTTQAMTSIEFSSSVGDAGNWVESIPTINSLAASDCHETPFTINVPNGTSAGLYNGTITASNGTYTDSISLAITVLNQSDAFNFSWTTAEFTDAGKDLVNWTIQNTGSIPITITRIKVSGWSDRDEDGATVYRVKLDNGTVWNDGGGTDGQWLDIDDFEIASGDSYSTNNKIEFDRPVNDDGEEFVIEFEFSDGSTYTTTTWPLYGGAADFNFSWTTAEFADAGRDLVNWTIQNTNDSNMLKITRIKVSGWSERDEDGATVYRVKLDNGTVWNDGGGTDGQWLDIDDFTLNMSTSYSTNNKIEFNKAVNDDGEEFVIEFEFSDGSTYSTETWPVSYTADLWELAVDKPQPLDFSTDINSTANTFGPGSGNDGWDWESGVYDSGGKCVRFNADPNDDNSPSDSTVGEQNRLRIQIGDYENQCENDGHGSGAYGVQFEVTQKMYDLIAAGGSATLSFDWVFDDHDLDDWDSGWIKARFGNASEMHYLGSNNGGSGDDDTPEIIYDKNPNDHSGSESIDVSGYITSAGTYYLELGGKVADWENNEWLETEFDNINLVFEE